MKNIKKYEAFLESDKQKMYYSAIDHWFNLPEFCKVEVEKAKNYNNVEVAEWKEKYGITDDTRLLWVTDDQKRGQRYDKGMFDGPIDYHERGLTDTYFDGADGFIIPESDDKGGYFLFVLK